MSALAVSPQHFEQQQLLGLKRGRRGDEFDHLGGGDALLAKRLRAAAGGSPARRAALVHLQLLYPAMAERELASLLAACDDDVEAAIRRLDELRLEQQQGGGAEPQQHQREAAAGVGGGAGPAAEEAKAAPAVSARYVDALVQEMAASRDLQDARTRATRVLEQVEADVVASAGAREGALQEQLTAALRDNAILKRAVAIQNSRHQEFATAAEEENRQLRGQLAAAQEELHHTKLSNYSLSLHLRQAMATPAFPDQPHHPPDVY